MTKGVTRMVANSSRKKSGGQTGDTKEVAKYNEMKGGGGRTGGWRTQTGGTRAGLTEQPKKETVFER